MAVAGGNSKRGMGIPTNLRVWELSGASPQSHTADVPGEDAYSSVRVVWKSYAVKSRPEQVGYKPGCR